VAPKDGTVLGAVSQGIPLQARLGHPQARFDPVKFNWIGRSAPSSNVTMVWRDSSARSFEDALKPLGYECFFHDAPSGPHHLPHISSAFAIVTYFFL
jgi:hypothetical protein